MGIDWFFTFTKRIFKETKILKNKLDCFEQQAEGDVDIFLYVVNKYKDGKAYDAGKLFA